MSSIAIYYNLNCSSMIYLMMQYILSMVINLHILYSSLQSHPLISNNKYRSIIIYHHLQE